MYYIGARRASNSRRSGAASKEGGKQEGGTRGKTQKATARKVRRVSGLIGTTYPRVELDSGGEGAIDLILERKRGGQTEGKCESI